MCIYLDNCFPQILDHICICQLCHHKVLGWSMNHHQDNQTLFVQKLRKCSIFYISKSSADFESSKEFKRIRFIDNIEIKYQNHSTIAEDGIEKY